MIRVSFRRSGLIAMCVSLASCVWARTPSGADTLRLSLDECIAIALDDNPVIKVADLEIARVDLTKRSTVASLLPTVSFAGQYNRTLAKQTMYMSMDGFGGAGGDNSGDVPQAGEGSDRDAGIKVGLDNSWSLGFNASLPIIAPQIWATLKLDDIQIMASVESARSSRLSMVREVKNAYYSLLLAEDSRKVMEENYAMALYTADIYRRRFELGTASGGH